VHDVNFIIYDYTFLFAIAVPPKIFIFNCNHTLAACKIGQISSNEGAHGGLA
jgi:hypothetical protein